MRSKKIICGIIVLAVAALICFIKLSGPSYNRVLKANWGIGIPASAGCSEIYSKDSGASFHGDGTRYHVFSYKNDEKLDTCFKWTKNDSLCAAADLLLDEIDAADEMRPAYEDCSLWCKSHEDNSEIIILKNSDSKMLYIVEKFI